MILIIFNIMVLLSTKEALKCPIKENYHITKHNFKNQKMHLFSFMI
ncbi:hypothetical protein AMTRI_Chr02g254750 [Amborella trichopoda]